MSYTKRDEFWVMLFIIWSFYNDEIFQWAMQPIHIFQFFCSNIQNHENHASRCLERIKEVSHQWCHFVWIVLSRVESNVMVWWWWTSSRISYSKSTCATMSIAQFNSGFAMCDEDTDYELISHFLFFFFHVFTFTIQIRWGGWWCACGKCYCFFSNTQFTERAISFSFYSHLQYATIAYIGS